MTLLQAIILGIVQGITEFLPISSSGHLVLGETLLNLNVSELKDFDVTVHIATLFVILIYFWRDIIQPKYWAWLIIATIPAVIVGFTLEDRIDAIFRSATAVGIMMIILGSTFMIPESFGKKHKKFTPFNVIAIGLAQAFALIPGVSRSGSTIFTGTMLGLEREEAARFSFMLGAIAIAGAGLLSALDLSELTLSYGTLGAGFIATFASGLLAVHWLMGYLKKHSLNFFGAYLVAIGAVTVIATML